MRENVILQKSYDFSLKIVKLYQDLIKEKKDYVIFRQILRSGTAIGSNIEEAIGGQSKKDFISKFSIAYKEARETHYWLRILRDSNFIGDETAKKLLLDCEELIKIITSIQKTAKSKLITN